MSPSSPEFTLRSPSTSLRVNSATEGSSGQANRPAAFLDRDGTIIRDTEYLRDPDQVELLPGAAAAIRRLNDAGWPVIVVTNQSGIARGLLTEQDYERVRMRVDKLIAEEGAKIDASYHCPHHPDLTGPCACRKPGTKLYSDAAAAHGLDTAASWYVGDRLRDVSPADHFGGRSIMLLVESTPEADRAAARDRVTAHSLAEAVDLIMGAGR
jgi:D-glycero-D-manno-heptose 1,7-bisphosphate phosphatase